MVTTFTVSEELEQLLVAASIEDLPAARSALGKKQRHRGSGGCHSGAGLHAGAPVTMAVLGNSTTAERLRAWGTASDVGKTSNLTFFFTKS